VLWCEGLACGHGGEPVVRLASLSVGEGETCVVVGPNGVGKSTLLRCIALLAPPLGGTLELLGSRIGDHDRSARSRLGSLRRQVTLLHQRPVVFATDVRANVAFGLRARGLDRQTVAERVERALEQVGLSELAGRPAPRLSGGETQRLVIARAFALETPLLLLDEPFSYLDAEARPLLHRLLAERRAQGGAVVIATHDLDGSGLRIDQRLELERLR